VQGPDRIQELIGVSKDVIFVANIGTNSAALLRMLKFICLKLYRKSPPENPKFGTLLTQAVRESFDLILKLIQTRDRSKALTKAD
jgi:hypothetical protein